MHAAYYPFMFCSLFHLLDLRFFFIAFKVKVSLLLSRPKTTSIIINDVAKTYSPNYTLNDIICKDKCQIL